VGQSFPMKVLITGCSFSAGGGWLESNLHYHYSQILQNSTNWQLVNRAVGGCSNREISLRTVENCLLDYYDFCIVQWSSLHRLWLYEAEHNIDNKTQIFPSTCGWGDLNAATKLSKMMIGRYLNDYMALKQWFLDQISLQAFFEKNHIKHVFIRGFPNYCPDIQKILDQGTFSSIPEIEIPTNIKKILNFEENPDDYLYDKILTLIKLYQLIDKSKCIGYNTNNTNYGLLENFSNDRADDGMHPGKQPNQLLSQLILDYCYTTGIKF
jgi:hypothetical protein